MSDSSNPRARGSRSWLTGAQYWVKITARPSLLAAATTIFTLAGTSLLYRTLSEIQAGQLALLLSLSELLSMVCVLGMPTVVTRLYSTPEHGGRDWLYDVALTMGVSLLPIAVATGLVIQIYDLPWIGILYLPFMLFILSGLQVTAALLNAAGSYTWSAVLLRLPNAMVLGAWVSGVILPSLSSLGAALAFHLGTAVVSLVGAVLLLHRTCPRGTLRIPVRQRMEGLAFLGSSLTMVMPDQGLVAVAGRLLTPQELAAFAAAAILLRPFRLLRSVLASILMPELIRRGQGGYRRYFLALGSLAAAAGLISALALPPLARWFYGSRYAEGIAVVPILAVAGVLHLITVIQKSDFSARATASNFSRYVLTLVLAVSAAMALGAVGVILAGVLGLALAVVLAEATGFLVSLAFWLRFRQVERRRVSAL